MRMTAKSRVAAAVTSASHYGLSYGAPAAHI